MDKDLKDAPEVGASELLEAVALKECGPVPRVAVNEQLKPKFMFLRTQGAAQLPLVALPPNFKLESAQAHVEAFEKTQLVPYRRRGTYVAADVPSLLRWMDSEAATDSPVFAAGLETLGGEWRNPKLSLIGIANYSVAETADWHDLQVKYDFPVSFQWATWAKHHSPDPRGETVWFKQADFAEFVEDHIHEIDVQKSDEDPGEAVWRFIEANGGKKEDYATPAELFRISRELKLYAASKCEVKFDLQTGEHKVQYSEEHTGPGGRALKLPSLFFIRIPVFFGQSPVLIGVKLRYRNAGQGAVVFSYSLFAPEVVVADEFKRACEQVKHEGRTVYLGTPDRP